MPLMLMTFEFVEKKRFTRLFWLTAGIVPICLLPTLVPRVGFEIFNLVGIELLKLDPPAWLEKGLSLPITPSFLIGSAGAQLTGGLHIRSDVSHHFLSLMAPTLLATTFISFFWSHILSNTGNPEAVWQRFCTFMALVLGSVVFFSLLYFLINTQVSAPIWVYHLGVITILLMSLSIDIRLFIWIVAFLFPFYLLYTERVHLAYVCMPLVLTVVAVNARCWLIASNLNVLPRKIIKSIIAIGFCVGTADAVTIPIATSNVMTGVADGIKQVATVLGEMHSKKNIDIISNVIHADDLRLFHEANLTRNYNGPQIYLTVRGGHDGSIKVIDSPRALSDYSRSKSTVKDVYFLDVWHPRLPEKRFYHRHNFVATCAVETGPRQTIHETVVEYPFFDPIRYLDGRRYFAFLGPPDLQDDFYFGPSERTFRGRVYARYDLYKVHIEKAHINQDTQFGRTFLRDPTGIELEKIGGKFRAKIASRSNLRTSKAGCSEGQADQVIEDSLSNLVERLVSD
ncbi:MAG: hypothetical protein VYA17_03820 [Pseudomonadota bacterium]|nr:hypothetical protein [Pseudomonadota bacterium]